MKFRAHETFFIRKGWLYKGLRGVQNNQNVFIDKNENPMDVLGMGSNMVKSLRYWMQATQLTTESSVKGRSRAQTLTDFAQIIRENDPYMEELGTLWLLHYKLATNKELATAWYYFFNHFDMNEFTRNDFVEGLSRFAAMEEEYPAEASLEDDFNCIINTYVERKKLNPAKAQPESNIACPLDELGLIEVTEQNGNRDRVFRKATPKTGTIHPYILLAVIADQAKGRREIKIDELQHAACNIGKVFNLDIVSLTAELDHLARLGYVEVIRTAGLDVVKLLSDLTYQECINAYYTSLNR